MPVYVVACANCGPQEMVARMSEAAAEMACPVCNRPRPQVFFPPNFTEDRLRMWKGPLGNRWSHALGDYMPDSRGDRDKMAKAKGVEFCSVTDLRRDSKEADEALSYRAHVDSGGKRDDPKPAPAANWKHGP